MVSLSYFDEHLAWQQRVQKEITSAHRTSPIYRELNPKLLYRYRTVDNDSTVTESHQKPNDDFSSLNVFAEVRGKYSRPVNNMESITLPALKSRASSSVTGRKQTSSTFNSKQLEVDDFDGKTLQELQKLLRQERLRRMKAERELKKKAALMKMEV